MPPAETLAQPVAAGEVTCRGREWLTVSPAPVSPLLLKPQHHKVASARTAQVSAPPADTLAQPSAAGLVTCCGRSCGPVTPTPSWPLLPVPQHHRVPSARTAQVCSSPADTLAHPAAAGVVTWCGRVTLVSFPRPSWPVVLRPQHHRAPSLRVAQANPHPALTLVQAAVGLGICWGTSSPAVLPVPSAPLVPLPQHHRVLPSRMRHVVSKPAET